MKENILMLISLDAAEQQVSEMYHAHLDICQITEMNALTVYEMPLQPLSLYEKSGQQAYQMPILHLYEADNILSPWAMACRRQKADGYSGFTGGCKC